MRILIAKYSSLLSLIFAIKYTVLQHFLDYNIDELFNFPLSGLLIILTLIFVFVLFQKTILKRHNYRTLNLVLLCFVVCFIAETVFQTIRLFFILNYDLRTGFPFFLKGTLGVSFMGAIIAFFVAYQLKTRKTSHLVGYIILFLIIISVITYLFPNLL